MQALSAQVSRMEAELATLKQVLAQKQQQRKTQKSAAATMSSSSRRPDATASTTSDERAYLATQHGRHDTARPSRHSTGGIGRRQGCPLLNELAVPPESEPLSDVAAWEPATRDREPLAKSSNFYMFVPPLQTEADQHTLRRVLRANQFPFDPADCNRTLVLADDAITAGLGYSARLIALALLVAVQEQRVLVMPEHHTRRWCARPPYTLGCYYEPITHCRAPVFGANGTFRGPDGLPMHLPKWSTRGSSMGLAHRRSNATPAHVRIGTAQVHKSTFWYKFHPPIALFGATHEILFRPRPWVLKAARCVMDHAGLRGGNFAVVHARFSVEKKKERGASLPPLSTYLPLTRSVLARANASHVFLQTSTPTAVDLFERWSAEHAWRLSYTENPRSTHDIWVAGSGRRSNHSGERTSVVAQAVNAFIASESHHFISPASSMWTWFVRALMARRVSDAFQDSGGEMFESCVAALEAGHQDGVGGGGGDGGGGSGGGDGGGGRGGGGGGGGSGSTGTGAGTGGEGGHNGHNVTLQEKKRCKKAIPKLIDIHRTSRADEESGGGGGLLLRS